jgi:hypothetical protein
MTQAFNLSQLGNRVNTSGQLDASTGLVNITPVANGGTGRSSITAGRLLVGAGTSAMTELAGTTAGDAVTWNGTTWVSGQVGGAAPIVRVYTSPATWARPSTLKAITVTVVGAGGAGGPRGPALQGVGGGGGGGGASIFYAQLPAIPSPVAVTAGAGTNSFGAFASATAGSAGSNGGPLVQGGAGGSGSGGSVNMGGGSGSFGFQVAASSTTIGGAGGSSILGGGGAGGVNVSNGASGGNFGGGGGGAADNDNGATVYNGGAGAPGIVIVEEFY